MKDSSAKPSSLSVGFVVLDTCTAEQETAKTFLSSEVNVTTLELSSISDPADLSEFEVLWWHQDTAVDEGVEESTAAAVHQYVTEGGNLLLSLRALEFVDALGIEQVPPDNVEETYVPNHKWEHEPAGILIKSRYRDCKIFDGFDDTHIHTQPSHLESVPRVSYTEAAPREGEVLASAFVDEDWKQAENTVIAWSPGDGRVIGIGQYLRFTEAEKTHRSPTEALLEGVFEYLTDNTARPISRPTMGDGLAFERIQFASDQHKPAFHFSPPANWLNDPNGLIEWDGKFHLFYQYNPAGPYHGSIHWGHAYSEDLIHWEDQPIALNPDPDSPDSRGCWSGCAVVDDGSPALVYTGGDGKDQLPCLAFATDENLQTWEKFDDNPVIEAAPETIDILSNEFWNAEFRDHDVWFSDGVWYHLIGSGIENDGGTAILYTSINLKDWDLVGPIFVGDREKHGAMWECPELLEFDDGHVLQVSNYDKVAYFTGLFDGENFQPDTYGIADHGTYYAAQTMTDTTGRQLSIGWIREDRDSRTQWEAGWSGVMSLPRVISLHDGTRLVEPAPEVQGLREQCLGTVGDVLLGPSENVFEEAPADSFELAIEFELADATALELAVGRSDEGEETVIRYTENNSLTVDRSQSTQSSHAATDTQRIKDVPGTDDGSVSLTVYADGSVIEIFVNGRTALSSRIYPTGTISDPMAVNVIDGTVTIHDASVWEMGNAFDIEAPSLQTADD